MKSVGCAYNNPYYRFRKQRRILATYCTHKYVQYVCTLPSAPRCSSPLCSVCVWVWWCVLIWVDLEVKRVELSSFPFLFFLFSASFILFSQATYSLHLLTHSLTYLPTLIHTHTHTQSHTDSHTYIAGDPPGEGGSEGGQYIHKLKWLTERARERERERVLSRWPEPRMVRFCGCRTEQSRTYKRRRREKERKKAHNTSFSSSTSAAAAAAITTHKSQELKMSRAEKSHCIHPSIQVDGRTDYGEHRTDPCIRTVVFIGEKEIRE